MTKSTNYATKTFFTLFGLYLVGLAISAIMAVFNMIEWSNIGEYALKAGLVVIIISVLSFALGFLVSQNKK